MMSMLEKLIYIADYIEPGRTKAKNLQELRRMAFENLDRCLFKILIDTIEYLDTNSIPVDISSIEAYNYFKAIV